jgi:hypothetical protein
MLTTQAAKDDDAMMIFTDHIQRRICNYKDRRERVLILSSTMMH